MRDARIGEKALEVCLRQGGEIAIDESSRGYQNQKPLHLRHDEKRLENTDQDDEAGGL